MTTKGDTMTKRDEQDAQDDAAMTRTFWCGICGKKTHNTADHGKPAAVLPLAENHEDRIPRASKQTPGPRVLDTGNHEDRFPRRGLMARTLDGNVIRVVDLILNDGEATTIDAAAVPELLAALERVEYVLARGGLPSYAHEIAYAAIVKVRGAK